MNVRTFRWQQGISIVEVLVGISILAVVSVTIGLSVDSYVDSRGRLLTETKATYLAEEGYEILRAIRDEDWTTISSATVDTPLYLDVTPTTLGLSGTPEVVDTDYTRSVVLRSVYRNADDDIVASTAPGATLDSDSRTAEISVTGPSGTVTLDALLSDVHGI